MIVLGALAAGCAENATPEETASPVPPVACLPDLDGVLIRFHLYLRGFNNRHRDGFDDGFWQIMFE